MIRKIFKRLRTAALTRLSRKKTSNTDPLHSLVHRYNYFQELLYYNNDALKLIAEIEDKLSGNHAFGSDYIKLAADRINLSAFQVIKALNHVANNQYAVLYQVLDSINGKIDREVYCEHMPSSAGFVVPYKKITRSLLDDVGGKNANLGEIRNNIGLLVPDGFAITTNVFDAFVGTRPRDGSGNNLYERIHKKLSILELTNQVNVDAVSKEIQSMIIDSDIPEGLLRALGDAYDDLCREVKKTVHVAMRSSAVNEDGDLSFAGQYTTVLNITKQEIPNAYKQVIASLYCVPAIMYRYHKGLLGAQIRMGVGCIEMIDAKTAGIIYTLDPNNPRSNTVIINAVRGLGKFAVDGTVTPDAHIIDRSSMKVVKKHIAEKNYMLTTNPVKGVDTVAVGSSEKNLPCLTDEQALDIAKKALTIEKHYNAPQDIEWCIDRQDRFFILQSRQLRFSPGMAKHRKKYQGYPVVLDRGSIVCPGIGSGRAFVLMNEQDIIHVPEGSVLVAPHASPALVRIMGKVKAIVTDTGGISGHMASMAREFNIPTITDAVNSTSVIHHGDEITVDAGSLFVYKGIVKQSMEKEITAPSFMKGTPVYQMLQKVAGLITPLHLTDPAAKDFVPESCKTIHDLIRYCHEKAISSMFYTCDNISEHTTAIKAGIRLPVDLYIIDIGNGLKDNLHKGRAGVDNIDSVPFHAFMKGLMNKNIKWWEPRRIDIKGFFSVLSSHAASIEDHTKPIGRRTYAAISKNYFNFNSRVGYHFSTIDSYCDDIKNNNYITFYFQGGASEDIRRMRRIRFLRGVLNAIGFVTETTGDRVTAYMRKYDRKTIEEKLEMLGKLTLCALHLDMLMTTDASVEWFTKAFLEGNYNFEFK